MANPYYQAGADRSSRVEALFASIARRYDLLNDLQSLGWHRLWKRRLVRSLALQPGQCALDVCCGTGDVTRGLTRLGVRTVGVDFSLPMLREAVARVPVGPGGAAFVAGDALRLPFPSGKFDAVTVAYGLRNLPDFAAALKELGRVTRPGGRLAILDFSKPSNRVWRRLYFTYLEWVVPILGRLFCGDAAAYAYILESLRHYPDASGISDLLRDGGWTGVRAENLLGGVMALHLAHKSGADGNTTTARRRR